MDAPSETEPNRALAQPTRAQIVRMLGELRRPAPTREIADRLGLHPNGVRLHLDRLRTDGLLDRLRVAGARGRPRDEWVLAAGVTASGDRPTDYRELARWLVRLVHDDAGIEAIGVKIGRETAPEPSHQGPVDRLQTALTSFGFRPTMRVEHDRILRYELRNCPYRDAAREDQEVVCTLHRGITTGLLERIAPAARLAAFVPKDPYRAGCLIDVAGLMPTADASRRPA